MAKVICTGIFADLREPWVGTGRIGKAESCSWESLRDSLKGDDGQAVSQSKHRGDGSAKRVAGQPDHGIGVQLRHVGK